MSLPPKRKPVKSGIERALKREWPRHRKFLRSFQCVVRGCEDGPIEVSHIRTAANAGTGIKPHDSSAVPMCHAHHLLYHERGHDTFTNLFQLDLAAIAATFTRMSPDKAMRDSLNPQREEGRDGPR